METKQVTQEMREQLRKPLPNEAVHQHPTKKFLSTIKAIYVVERLNDVFGIGGWRWETNFIERQEKMVVVKSTLSIPEYNIFLECFGGNDNVDLGDAYKGASTDGLTKLGSYLEIGIDVFKGLHTGNIKATTDKTIEKQTLKQLLMDDLRAMSSIADLERFSKSMDEVKAKLLPRELEEVRYFYQARLKDLS